MLSSQTTNSGPATPARKLQHDRVIRLPWKHQLGSLRFQAGQGALGVNPGSQLMRTLCHSNTELVLPDRFQEGGAGRCQLGPHSGRNYHSERGSPVGDCTSDSHLSAFCGANSVRHEGEPMKPVTSERRETT
ncbi:hypothetical protein NDU88_001121 [Pleurodeles waltl]|uniref:Uncharacterized protein n=1 Tax=Pleurodeles waltl TaxID=8319 RepID=A0AAV7Q3C5_PLEWA|nr:hypothetical protein NDU88_001121 [Pleurodeles waltl]